MLRILLKYHPEKYAQYWLALSLLFSIFAFSPAIGNAQAQQLFAVQTELVESKNTFTQAIFSYRKAVVKYFSIEPALRFSVFEEKTLAAYQSLIKVAFDHYSGLFYDNQSVFPFLQLKTIPQSSNEDDPFFLPIG